MRYILILLLFISGAASAQFAPTSAKSKFSNGIAIGSKDTSAFSAADTMVLTIARDSVMYYKYRGVWRPIATGGNLNNYKLISDTLFNNGYTTRARTKQYGDSIAALKLNISDTAAMLTNRLKISDTAAMLLGLSLDRVLANGNTSGRDISVAKGTFASSGDGTPTVDVTHSSGSGIGLSITKGGNGEGLYVNKTSGSGNAATIIGTLNATTLVKSGGLSTEFLKADGSVDATSYLPYSDTGTILSQVVRTFGTQTVNGLKTFSSGLVLGENIVNDSSVILYQQMASDDYWSIFGTGSSADNGELVFQLGDNGSPFSSEGQRFRWSYKNQSSGTYKDVLLVDYDTITTANVITALAFNKSGGTSSQFLKADGSVDGTAYGTGSVTSVATNTGSGITGGTITTTGTIAADTSILSTKANVVGLLVGYTTTAANALKLNISDTATMLNPYVRGSGTNNTIPKFNSTTRTLTNSLITDNGSLVTLGSNTYVNGALGIGTTLNPSPITVLASSDYSNIHLLRSASANTAQRVGIVSRNYGGSDSYGLIAGFDGAGTEARVILGLTGSIGANVIAFNTAPSYGSGSTERMRISSGGNLLLKTTTDNGTDALQVAGSVSATSSVTANSFVKSGGTSSQALIADGSVQTLTSGTYTPTITNTTNITSSTLSQATYTQIGNIVTVNIGVTLTPTTSPSNAVLTVSLPITTATGTQNYVGSGTFFGDILSNLDRAGIVSITSTTTASFTFFAAFTTTSALNFQFQYKIN